MMKEDPKMANQRSPSPRGFAAMDPKKQREIARLGGAASPGNFKHNRKRAAELGRRGGKVSRRTR